MSSNGLRGSSISLDGVLVAADFTDNENLAYNLPATSFVALVGKEAAHLCLWDCVYGCDHPQV